MHTEGVFKAAREKTSHRKANSPKYSLWISQWKLCKPKELEGMLSKVLKDMMTALTTVSRKTI